MSANFLLRLSYPRLGLSAKLKPSSLAGAAFSKERVSWRQFFDSEYFWNKANVGPFFLFLFTSPYWYGGLKSIYASCKYRKLNEKEIISDRFSWLHERMLEDEVERVVLQQVPRGGFDRTRPGLLLGPSHL